ncbi:hypothetical protein F5887DRAFT_1162884, partial [Amanita rubescens]
MCTSLQNIEFKMITYSTKQSMPPLLYDRQQLKAMKSIKIRDAQCHFMDLLHHFACPRLEVLDVTNNRIQCSVGEQLRWFLSCETAFTDFLLHSTTNLKELSVFDDNESDPLDVGLAETLHYVYNQILRHPCVLQKELPVDRVMDPPPPAPGVLRAYIHDAVRGVACPRPREGHVPLAIDHSTNIMPKGYVFACDDCPQKTRNEKSILAIRMFAELADFHYDILIYRIPGRVKSHSLYLASMGTERTFVRQGERCGCAQLCDQGGFGDEKLWGDADLRPEFGSVASYVSPVFGYGGGDEGILTVSIDVGLFSPAVLFGEKSKCKMESLSICHRGGKCEARGLAMRIGIKSGDGENNNERPSERSDAASVTQAAHRNQQTRYQEHQFLDADFNALMLDYLHTN